MHIKRVSFTSNNLLDTLKTKNNNPNNTIITNNPLDKTNKQPETKKLHNKKYLYASILSLILLAAAVIKRKSISKFFSPRSEKNLNNKKVQDISNKVKIKKTEENIQVESPKVVKTDEPQKVKVKYRRKHKDESLNVNVEKISLKIKEQDTIIQKEKEFLCSKNSSLGTKFDENVSSFYEYITNYMQLSTNELDYCEKVNRYTTEDIINEVCKFVKKAEDDGIEYSEKLICALFKKGMLQQAHIHHSPEGYEGFQMFHRNCENRKMMNQLISIMRETPKEPGEKSLDYVNKIVQTRKNTINKQNTQRAEEIKKALTYSDNTSIEQIDLSNEDKKAFIEHLKYHDFNFRTEVFEKAPSKDFSWKELAMYWKRNYTGNNSRIKAQKPDLQRIEEGMLQRSFERYKTDNCNPVYRWVGDSSVTDIVRKIPDKGKVYKYNSLISCSTNHVKGEDCHVWGSGISNFDDRHPDSTLKFIIHPKSKESKSYFLENTAYGNYETVYPANTEFVILDKRLEEFVNLTDKAHEKSNFKWVIEMQEV